MTGKYAVRPYRPGDEEEIVQLLKHVFNGWPQFDLKCTPLEHWRWKYQENPFNEHFTAIATTGDKIIGTDHSLPTNIKIGEKMFFCTYAADMVVHPDFRRMEVSKKETELSTKMKKRRGVKFSYFVTGNPIFIKSFSRDYNLFPHAISTLVKINDVDLHFQMIHIDRAWLMKTGFHISKTLNKLGNLINRSEFECDALQFSDVTFFDDRIEEFWQKVSENHHFIIERSRDHLNWRYCDHRSGGFLIKQAEDDGRILGYIVLRINRYKKNYPAGYIVDLLTLPERLDVADALVGNAVEYFNDEEVNAVVTMVVRNHPYTKIFSRHGFLNSRVNLPLFYASYWEEDKIAGLEDASASKIHFSLGDIDVLPVSMPTRT